MESKAKVPEYIEQTEVITDTMQPRKFIMSRSPIRVSLVVSRQVARSWCHVFVESLAWWDVESVQKPAISRSKSMSLYGLVM